MYTFTAFCLRFSQKHSVFEKEPKLVDVQNLLTSLDTVKGNVKIISRVVIVNRDAVERLLAGNQRTR